ncbi:MAG: hypothetical protein PHV74_07630 [Dehalococcoidia bacterium]|nr:hypothetical protein [Dehalococcoidia bacterium]
MKTGAQERLDSGLRRKDKWGVMDLSRRVSCRAHPTRAESETQNDKKIDF